MQGISGIRWMRIKWENRWRCLKKKITLLRGQSPVLEEVIGGYRGTLRSIDRSFICLRGLCRYSRDLSAYGNPPAKPGDQTADKPRKRKNSFRQKKCGRNFCLLRQRRLQPAVTYVYVSSPGCKFASLPCRVFQRLAKRRLCQRFDPPAKPGG